MRRADDLSERSNLVPLGATAREGQLKQVRIELSILVVEEVYTK